MTENFTKLLYEKSYKIVDSSKMPIVIPSYNRPNFDFLTLIKDTVDEDITYPIFVVVRKSQEEMYLESTKDCKNVTIIAADDDTIKGSGLVREYISKEFLKRGYENLFMLDDDVSMVSCLSKKTNSMGNITSVPDSSLSMYKVFAILQFAHEELCNKFDKYVFTGIAPKFWCYHPWLSDSTDSLKILHKSLTQVFAINTVRFREFNIEYHDNETHGHEDSDVLFQILESGCLTGCVEGITYFAGKMDSDRGFESIEARFVEYWKRTLAAHPDLVEKGMISYNKKDIAHAHPIVRWKKGRKLYSPEYYTDNKFDLFNILTNTNRWRDCNV